MPVAPGTYDYYVVPWLIETRVFPVVDIEHDVEMTRDVWTVPAGSIGAIDIGPVDKGTNLAPNGVAVAWYLAGSTAPPNSISLGDDLNRSLSNGQKNQAANAVGLPNNSFTGDTIADVIWEILTTFADVDGIDRARPLMPTTEGVLELHLQGHSLIKSERFRWGTHPLTPKVQAILQSDYAKAKARQVVNPAKFTQRRLGQMLDWQREKYARMGLTDYRELLPPQYRDDVPVPHETTIADDFTNGGADTDLESWGGSGGGVTGWGVLGDANSVQALAATDVAQNVKTGGASNRYYANNTLSGTDHYCQANVAIQGGENVNQHVAVHCRLDGTDADDYYMAEVNIASNTVEAFYRSGGGTETSITSATPTTTAADGLLLRLEVNGSSIKVIYDGNTDIDTTDTNVTSGNYTGIYGDTNSSVRHPQWDNFEAADLGAGPAANPKGVFGLALHGPMKRAVYP